MSCGKAYYNKITSKALAKKFILEHEFQYTKYIKKYCLFINATLRSNYSLKTYQGRDVEQELIKNIGFVRTFLTDNDVDKNRSEILELAHKKQMGQVHIIEETFTGKKPWRKREIAGVIDRLRQGDSLLVSDFSQLGHTTRECIEILSIAMKKGVNIYSVKNNWHIDQNMQRETATMVFAMALEIDRDLSSKRTKEALRAKKASGASLGRPKGPGKSKLDPFRAEIKTLLKNGSTKAFIANRYKTTPANLSNWMKKHGITRSNSKGECEKTNCTA